MRQKLKVSGLFFFLPDPAGGNYKGLAERMRNGDRGGMVWTGGLAEG